MEKRILTFYALTAEIWAILGYFRQAGPKRQREQKSTFIKKILNSIQFSWKKRILTFYALTAEIWAILGYFRQAGPKRQRKKKNFFSQKLGITITNHHEKFHGAVSPLRHREYLQRQGSTKRTAPLISLVIICIDNKEGSKWHNDFQYFG